MERSKLTFRVSNEINSIIDYNQEQNTGDQIAYTYLREILWYLSKD